ncbi:20342_t:CDS:2 [Funneliformis geosporum]|uniref:11775_t:CDS:1 n=1 Tax=Funneliformis geosporum TaxID=1117311 RepID=A0A9W4SD87_9GLOM|nr:11775_t:CDS:2 [Funneliformis geosporum]CAI2166844.1 20342_t:CDS:2 [Funneliformis geosporum]
MTTNTITNVETLSAKQTNNTSKSNSSTTNTSLNLAKIIAQGRNSSDDWNSLLIWARKQRGPYYDPTTRMYHVSHNTKRYFAGYTEQDAEAEDATTVSQHKVNSNNQFKPIASIHNSEIITKDIIQLGNHMSNRVPSNAGRRPGRPRYKK